MSSFWRSIAFLLALAIAVGIGVAIYNAGVTAGIAEAARQAAASGDPAIAPPAWGWGGGYWHGPFGYGFGIFGFLFWLLGILLVIGLIRAAFGWGRWRGPGTGPGSGPGARGWGDRAEEWHRDLHRREVGDDPRQPVGS
ncbi:MAG TPA: hypothetical protein VHQ42_03560 [Candidatus Limnocylindria bacterium]|nr:hypothetical protein [Candidatus Limnocylindria bacterium]